MAKPGPLRLRPLTLRFLTAPARAQQKRQLSGRLFDLSLFTTCLSLARLFVTCAELKINALIQGYRCHLIGQGFDGFN
ncbi:hypothetical protein DA801_13065 [Lacticaseibacillus rhamnosus]|nr:hypothetical protein DA801_13065 [Lacticaseibacillus rhamnosus]